MVRDALDGPPLARPGAAASGARPRRRRPSAGTSRRRARPRPAPARSRPAPGRAARAARPDRCGSSGRPAVSLQVAPLRRRPCRTHRRGRRAPRVATPSLPPAQPQSQREVDVLVVEEELAREPARRQEVARGGSPGRLPRRSPGRPTGISSPASSGSALSRAARPGDPGEVDDAPARVDDAVPLSAVTSACHAAHPEPSPSGATIASRQPGRGDRVGVQEAQQLAGRLARAAVAAVAVAEVGAGLDTRARRAPARATACGGAVGRSRCRRRSARRRRRAAR